MTVQPTPPSVVNDPSGLPPVDRFLAPISAEKPSGEWLRFDPLYEQIKKLREEDDATLPQGVWKRALKRADWSGVAQLCESALELKTKDLLIAAWLTEAWIHRFGFRGLQRGLEVVNALCATFWDTLHPDISDGNTDARSSPLQWIAERLDVPVKSIPVTAPSAPDGVVYVWSDWESALYFTTERAMSEAQSKFLVSVSLTPAPWIAILVNDVAGTIAAVDALQKTIDEKLGQDVAPSLTPLRDPLASLYAFMQRVMNERVERGEIPAPAALAPTQPQHESTSIANEEVAMSSTTMEITAPGPVNSRAEAYLRLREASDFLMRTEPHSPVPYLVRRAISWGNLSLAELLEELLSKNADLNTVYALLGIRKS